MTEETRKVIRKIHSHKSWQWVSVFDAEIIIKALEAYEEPKQGEWKCHEDWAIKYGCNICGSLSKIKSSFCPTCGAKMKEGDPNGN